MPGSPDLLPVLLARAEELHANGDMDGTCQVLFLCAALAKHLNRHASAIQSLEQINLLAGQNNWSQVVQWVAWGSAAVQFHQGRIDLAAEHLDSLQSLLKQAGDWVLADLIEVLSASLSEENPESIEKDSLASALLGWGEMPFPIEIANQASTNGSPDWITRFKRMGMWFSSLFQRKLHPCPERESILPGNQELFQLAFKQGSEPFRMGAPLRLSPESTGNNDNQGPSLVVYCLGQFQVYQDEQPIDVWPTYKSKLVFKYLITHRQRPVAKEVLMDIFWPDSSPDAARNNLNVAIHGIRKVLHQRHPDFSHILFQEGQYSFNPNIRIWVDAEEFSRQIRYAKDLQSRADPAVILHEYQKAENLYQGDFLEEDRYEEWTIMPRESLRLAYLDCLGQLSQTYFLLDQYMASTALCQRILTYDDCSEDAYRLLMRCYVRQGQPNLALRLYHSCLETLKAELDMPPSPETRALYERIRRYEPV